jgi:hypothetical protein
VETNDRRGQVSEGFVIWNDNVSDIEYGRYESLEDVEAALDRKEENNPFEWRSYLSVYKLVKVSDSDLDKARDARVKQEEKEAKAAS